MEELLDCLVWGKWGREREGNKSISEVCKGNFHAHHGIQGGHITWRANLAFAISLIKSLACWKGRKSKGNQNRGGGISVDNSIYIIINRKRIVSATVIFRLLRNQMDLE